MHRPPLLTEQEHRFLCFGGVWLRDMGSHHDRQIQSLSSYLIRRSRNKLVGLAGFSPATFALGERCSLTRAAGRFKWYLRQELHPHDDVRSVAS